MEYSNLADNIKLIIKDNVLAIVSDNKLTTVSSAFFNGGFKQVKAVLNIGVPDGYDDRSLHLDPLALITLSAAKLGLTKDYLAMVTAAKVRNYSLVSKDAGDFSVDVVATAGCKHGESSGEEMDVQEIHDTINVIVLIDGRPAESCMVASIITATEAKSAALRDFDVRSHYTGDSATGSITDSVTIVSTNRGKTVSYGGPASKLGKLVGYCTRKAVTESLVKQEPIWSCRTVADRLKERHLSLEKLAAELSKADGLDIDEKGLAEILKANPIINVYLLAAARLDDDYKKGLLPAELKNAVDDLSRNFYNPKFTQNKKPKEPNYDLVDLPPFIKNVLIKIVKTSRFEN